MSCSICRAAVLDCEGDSARCRKDCDLYVDMPLPFILNPRTTECGEPDSALLSEVFDGNVARSRETELEAAVEVDDSTGRGD